MKDNTKPDVPMSKESFDKMEAVIHSGNQELIRKTTMQCIQDDINKYNVKGIKGVKVTINMDKLDGDRN